MRRRSPSATCRSTSSTLSRATSASGLPSSSSPPLRSCSRSGSKFDGIAEVKYRGLDTANPDLELTLLTIATGPGKEYLIDIDLVFEGDAQIQLRTNRIACRLDDFGAPEPCKVTPCDHLGQGWITEAPA